MRAYLLDTSVIIDYLRGKEEALEVINNIQGEITSSYFCFSELYEGVYRVKEKEQIENILKKFFDSLFEIYGINEEISNKFGELRAKLKKEGNIIEDIDIFIAATCLVNDLILVTFNRKHFFHIEGLAIL